jgi:cytochrome c556
MSVSKFSPHRAALGVLVLATVACGAALAQTPPASGAAPGAASAGPTPAERAIEYRQAVYKIAAGNFGPLSQVAQGKAEFKAEIVTKQATRLSQIATFVGEAYPDVSKEGTTRALPAIWTNRKEFDQIVSDFVTHTKNLADVAENSSSNGDEFKAAVAAVGNDCKSCHDKFRAK